MNWTTNTFTAVLCGATIGVSVAEHWFAVTVLNLFAYSFYIFMMLKKHPVL